MNDKLTELNSAAAALKEKYAYPLISIRLNVSSDLETKAYMSEFARDLGCVYNATQKLLGKRNFAAAMHHEKSTPKSGKKITKADWSAAKQLCQMILDVRYNYRIATKRHTPREAIPMPTPHVLLQRKIAKEAIEKENDLKKYLNYYPSFGGLEIFFDKNATMPSIENSTENLGKYSSRCTYQRVAHYCKITMSRKWKIDDTDGVTMLVKHSKNLENCTISQGWALARKGNSFEVSCTEMYCITDNRTSLSAHAENLKKAKKDLDRKVKTLLRNHAKRPLKLDDEITIAKYRELTGACQAGCERFCEREGLDPNGSILVRDLLRKLRGSDYGVVTFRNNVAMY